MATIPEDKLLRYAAFKRKRDDPASVPNERKMCADRMAKMEAEYPGIDRATEDAARKRPSFLADVAAVFVDAARRGWAEAQAAEAASLASRSGLDIEVALTSATRRRAELVIVIEGDIRDVPAAGLAADVADMARKGILDGLVALGERRAERERKRA